MIMDKELVLYKSKEALSQMAVKLNIGGLRMRESILCLKGMIKIGFTIVLIPS
tara:strand:- start:6947 stop:7105 length:159 start_codon:yes stop_codon:yes gene_type:complete